MKKKTEIASLSPGEAELLEIFWEHGPLTLSQVHGIQSGGSGRPTLQTIQTRLGRMVAKGLLLRDDTYPAVYRSAIAREQARGKFFDLLESLADRHLAPLMLRLAEKRKLTGEEVAALETILEKNRTETDFVDPGGQSSRNFPENKRQSVERRPIRKGDGHG